MSNNKEELRYYLFWAFIIALFVFVVSFFVNYLITILGVSSLLTNIIRALMAIVISITIVYSFTRFSRTISDLMTTMRRRLRFESLSNPLLLRLSYEAPGTYHHSLNVSNLAQRACKSIGADSLLARVAAYYHDIGKLKNPKQFIENQASSEIPTDEKSSSIRKDAKNIILHVENGIKLAKENNLPDDLISIISEHHGTTRTQYYFERAKKNDLLVKYTDFRYPGPTPQTKESAILMLADIVEATARSKEYLNDDIIEKIVNLAIEERLSEGQLKSANLSESELANVRTSMIKTLSSIYHQRISYTQ